MSKFNSKIVNKTENLAGGKAHRQSDKMQLVSLLLTSFCADQFYSKQDDTLARMRTLVSNIKDKEFIAKATIFARQDFGMRSITHALAVELANEVKGESFVKRFIEKVVKRPDDMTEMFSYLFANYGKRRIPNSLKKGVAKAFDKFDAYGLGKYKNEGKDVSLIDVVNLAHPVPTDKNRKALNLLVNGKLKCTETWEAKLSASTSPEEKEQAWKELILEGKLGYFAALRNIRNVDEQVKDNHTLNTFYRLLTDKDRIKKSLVMPFRFTTAMEQIQSTTNARRWMKALNIAVETSLDNVPNLEGKTLIALDTSGSMMGRPAEIGSLFSSVLYKSNIDADLMTFSNDSEYVTLNDSDSLFTMAKSIRFACGGTNFRSIFCKANKKYERIIILSDMQGWVGYDSPNEVFKQYKRKYNVNPFVYSFDLAGHGTLQFPEDKVFCLAGFSDKIFDVMSALEEDKNALVNRIDQVSL